MKKTGNWKKALAIVLEIIDELLRGKGLKWAVMGSVASILQGCKLQPNDIDILVEKPETVHLISSLHANHYGKKSVGVPFDKEKHWISTKEKPVYEGFGPYGFSWVYAKVKINNIFVEATHKLPPKDHPFMNETIWGIWTKRLAIYQRNCL